MTNQTYGSLWVHAVLLLTTAGIGNVAYGVYSMRQSSSTSTSAVEPSTSSDGGENSIADTEGAPEASSRSEDRRDGNRSSKVAEVVTASGRTGSIGVDDTKVVISRDGMLSTGTHGLGKGDLEIWFDSITGIEFEEPSFSTTGYIQIHQAGNHETSRGEYDRTQDDHTIRFGGGDESDFRSVKQAIESRAN